MSRKNAVVACAIAVGFTAAFVGDFRLRSRVQTVESQLETVSSGVQPVHLRCETLEADLGRAQMDLAAVQEVLTALSATVAAQEALLSTKADRITRLEKSVGEFRSESDRTASDLRATLDEQIRGAEVEAARLSTLGDQLKRLEGLAEQLPEGTILPWLPTLGQIPPGWLLCDGTRGTPNLRGLFLRGVGQLEQAGLYFEGARMQQAGAHPHAIDLSRSIDSLHSSIRVAPEVPRRRGDWMVLFDTGSDNSDPEALALHGSHVHADQHVPSHFTVAFIMKDVQ